MNNGQLEMEVIGWDWEIAELLTWRGIRVRLYEQEILVGFKHACEI